MKPLVIFHADCTDGFAAAFAAWLKLGDDAEYLPRQYGAQEEKWFGETFCSDEVVSTLDHREIYILDFSLPRPHMDYIFEHAKRVVWLDHHASAFEMWCGKYERGMRVHENVGTPDVHELILDDNKSGALLAWEWFHGRTEVPMLIQHIDDRDRWVWKLKGSAGIHAALSSMKPWGFEQWKELIADEHYGSLFSEGAAILRAQKQHVEKMTKQARTCTIDLRKRAGDPEIFTGLAVNASIHQSEIGHELANQSGTYGLVWYLGDNGRVRCSLRSNGEYDVSAIARAFGGGGHRNAAGFETDIETLMNWLT